MSAKISLDFDIWWQQMTDILQIYKYRFTSRYNNMLLKNDNLETHPFLFSRTHSSTQPHSAVEPHKSHHIIFRFHSSGFNNATKLTCWYQQHLHWLLAAQHYTTVHMITLCSVICSLIFGCIINLQLLNSSSVHYVICWCHCIRTFWPNVSIGCLHKWNVYCLSTGYIMSKGTSWRGQRYWRHTKLPGCCGLQHDVNYFYSHFTLTICTVQYVSSWIFLHTNLWGNTAFLTMMPFVLTDQKLMIITTNTNPWGRLSAVTRPTAQFTFSLMCDLMILQAQKKKVWSYMTLNILIETPWCH